MKILGYRPYHLFETVTVHGETHLKIFKEALIAQFNYFSGIRRLRKPDVEKWLADYDVSHILQAFHWLFENLPDIGNRGSPKLFGNGHDRRLCRRSRCQVYSHREGP